MVKPCSRATAEPSPKLRASAWLPPRSVSLWISFRLPNMRAMPECSKNAVGQQIANGKIPAYGKSGERLAPGTPGKKFVNPAEADSARRRTKLGSTSKTTRNRPRPSPALHVERRRGIRASRT